VLRGLTLQASGAPWRATANPGESPHGDAGIAVLRGVKARVLRRRSRGLVDHARITPAPAGGDWRL
jgi:hypothetical protein